MDEQEYAKQINTGQQPLPKPVCYEIAKKVAGLLQQEGTREYFSAQITCLCKMAEEFARHAQKCLKDSKLAVKCMYQERSDCEERKGLLCWHKGAAERAGKQQDTERIDKEIAEIDKEYNAIWAIENTPPERGCTMISLLDDMWNFFDLGLSWPSDYRPLYRWIRPGPVNPLPWFETFSIWGPQNLIVAERRMRDCFLLASIHDREFHAPTSRLYDSHELIFSEGYQGRFKRDDFAEAIWHHYSKDKSDDGSRALQNAYSRVESYLAELPKSKQPPTPPAEPQGGAESGQTGETKRITKEEANVCARQLLMKTPSWDWTCRKLEKQIPCCLGWISSLPAWRAYHEKRKELRRNKTIETVSLSDELEAVLGEGEKDEVLKQLIAEEEGEERENARRAKLYLSQQRKPKRSSR